MNQFFKFLTVIVIVCFLIIIFIVGTAYFLSQLLTVFQCETLLYIETAFLIIFAILVVLLIPKVKEYIGE